MLKINGGFTLPSEENFYAETVELIDRLGADALRDCDGTKLSEDLKCLDIDIYSTYFVARGYNSFAEKHLDERQHYYLMSERYTAGEEALDIPFTEAYFARQMEADYDHDPKEWWEVIDRSSGKSLAPEAWTVDRERNVVTILKPEPYHVYTVDFLAYANWDPTEMYNHLTNNWGDKAPHIPFDARGKASAVFMEEALEQWLKDNPQTDIVRFTTFFYHFTLLFNKDAKEKYVDWFGYTASVSPEAILEFSREYGYRPTAEDFVDEGYYHSPFRQPTKFFLDYMDFTQRFVAEKARRLVEIVHKAGRKAVMFLGDTWIGTEPYGKYFASIGLDGVVGSVGDGVTLRLISDIPGVSFTEGRFLPYFFPDTFHPGGQPTEELLANWRTARRAIFRQPVKRIGYGGYLSLAYAFPDFIDRMQDLAEEYRTMMQRLEKEKPRVVARVAVLNAWGRIRSWQPWIVAHGLWYKRCYSYLGILEALSGMDVEVSFISFEDVLQGKGLDVDVIINAGDAGTSWSGGDAWKNPELCAALRRFTVQGGGFIGIGQPCAVNWQGSFFQLSDVLGVDQELGFSQSHDRYFKQVTEQHFITANRQTPFDFGEGCPSVYALDENSQILEYSQQEVHLAARDYGGGRSVYLAGLPYSPENAALLRRAILFAAHKEAEINRWQIEDPRAGVAVFPEQGTVAIMNNSAETIQSIYTDGEGEKKEITLAPSELLWL